MGAKAYPAYRDSGVEWIGDIPEHWEVKRTKSVVSILKVIAGKLGYEVISVTQRGLRLKDTSSFDGQNAQDYSKYQLVHVDDYVLNHMDLLTGYVGKSTYLGVTSPDYRVVRTIDTKRTDRNFTLFLFQNCYHHRLWYKYGQGAAHLGRWRLPRQEFNEFQLPSPPLQEQKQIAAFLDRETSKIDTLIEKQKQLINLLKEKRGSLISHTVTKGLNPNAPMKDSGVEWIGEIPEHWEVKRLGRSCVVSPKRSKSLLSNLEQLVSFLPMTAFNNDGTADYSSEVVLESVVSGYTYMEFGDIAISKVTPCFENGKAARLKNMPTKVGFGTTEVTVIRPLRMFGDYVFYIFRVPEVVDLGVSWMYGVGGLQRIPDSFFEQLVTPFPPLEEQKQIASFLDAETSKIDTLIEKANQSIALLKERRSSLISAAVTGKIDVREAV